MKGAMIRCVRCKGRKRIFKTHTGYSYVDTGGTLVDCPMCLGEGQVKTLAQAIEDAKALKEENAPVENKGSEDAKKDRSKAKGKK